MENDVETIVLLSGELVTKLTGRYLEFEMYPLTFDEYLGMKSFMKLPVDNDVTTEFENYITEGGFPKTLSFTNLSDKRVYVKGVISEIFEKDIRKRVKVRNVSVFNIVQTYIMNNFGATKWKSSNTKIATVDKNGKVKGKKKGKVTITAVNNDKSKET